MLTMNVAELEGALLDYWAGRAENINPACLRIVAPANVCEWRAPDGNWKPWQPSTRWGQGGKIIERERITVQTWPDDWAALHYGTSTTVQAIQRGATPLIAAMRAFTAKRYGDTVPEVLA